MWIVRAHKPSLPIELDVLHVSFLKIQLSWPYSHSHRSTPTTAGELKCCILNSQCSSSYRMPPQLRRLIRHSLQLIPLLLFSILIARYWTASPSSMPSSPSPKEVASSLLADKGYKVDSVSLLQSLWAGYGQICRISATDASDKSHSFVLKLITPPPTRAGDEGHTRKILSYQVEQYFYSHLAPQLPASVHVAKCLASINEHHSDGTSKTAMILNDLKKEFPVAGEKRGALSPVQVGAALDWLAGFHGFWWPRAKEFDGDELVLPPLEEVKEDGQDASKKTVWLNGGCTSHTYNPTTLQNTY